MGCTTGSKEEPGGRKPVIRNRNNDDDDNNNNNDDVKVKVKFSLCFTKRHVMRTNFWGSESAAPCILNIGTR
jgi:hypothetical protein